MFFNGKNICAFSFALTIIAISYQLSTAIILLHKIEDDPNLFQFNQLINANPTAKYALLHKEITIFAPTNDAFEKFEGKLTNDLVLYHMVGYAVTLNSLNNGQLDTLMGDKWPIWVGQNNQSTYVNNARIIKDWSDTLLKSRSDSYGKLQVLHMINEVLDPISYPENPPTAYDYLSQPNLWLQLPSTPTNFYKAILQNRKQQLFKNNGNKNTYFIPADESLNLRTLMSVDKHVIDGHILVDRVIFTNAAEIGYAYKTNGYDHYSYDIIEFLNNDDGACIKNTRISKVTDRKINEKLVNVLQANVPLKNGVIHVIDEPLGIFKRKLTKFPYLPVIYKIQADPELNITHYFIEKLGLQELLSMENCNFTLFLPTDTAWINLFKEKGIRLSELSSNLFLAKAKRIIERHIIINDLYPMSRLLNASRNLRGSEVILDVMCEERIMVRVELERNIYRIYWSTFVIQVRKPDYECTNGVVHVIDRPLITDAELRGLEEDKGSWMNKVWGLLKHTAI